MKVDGLHHVTAITADIEANLGFYGRLPGLRPVWQGVNADNPEIRLARAGVAADRMADRLLARMFVAAFVGLSLPVAGVGITLSRRVSPKDTILGSAIAGIAACAITLAGRTAPRARRPAAAGRGADSPGGKPGHQPIAKLNERKAL